MADVVNLRRARKVQARREAENAAAAQRLAYGRTKAERERAEAEHRLDERRLEGHVRQKKQRPDDGSS